MDDTILPDPMPREWTDSEIWNAISGHSFVEKSGNIGERELIRADNAAHIAKQVRDDYEQQLAAALAEMARLQAELEAERVRTQWQPLPEGEYVDVTISLRTVRFEGRRLNRQPMPEEYAFCRKVTEANDGVAQPNR
jgi:hypothetical protein